jgi:hypothetical protein
MHIDQYLVLFYVLFSLSRALLWVARQSDGAGSMLLLLATVLAVSFSCAEVTRKPSWPRWRHFSPQSSRQ